MHQDWSIPVATNRVRPVRVVQRMIVSEVWTTNLKRSHGYFGIRLRAEHPEWFSRLIFILRIHIAIM
jgi:hypothetical protein